ncbi:MULTISPECIES: DUF418 domain-containing protein [Variovorax]|jgi:uncharacterized protein|uniref:DUF418 domain-containing protein n=1 Tax=Variovorax TaxID=34072 RepID=UPI00086F79F6|nr:MULTISPECIES: DUF418 domain-containing protein [Variovorax]MBN8753656.1 DUF418 domain-containing protein [Variovorax sp.]ODU17322.1 MAG: hypothetical protein ABS94_09925 [Variovorax sp. SCN 67-85]ODV18655.1 MAG: hypothetical protein ABT25_27730 [Variovorax sp. SCN 67-20]OJZ02700.1 MAG: hypothetical protein BGP22_20030 [Variovorax sp. 67-131]UKI10825.1 DUF418 domain-containing protein [Variovorax paradoxus]
MSTTAPARERQSLVDALRGFALLGILVVNIATFASPFYGMGVPDPMAQSAAERAALFMRSFLFETKFYLLFSFLFGYSFTLQMDSAERDGKAFAPRMLRRLLGLWVLGLLHAVVLYHGDILTTYAAIGGVLLLLRRRGDGFMAFCAVALVLVTSLLWASLGYLMTRAGIDADTRSLHAEAMAALHAYRGTPATVIAQHLRELAQVWVVLALAQAPTALAMFLAGFIAGRRGLLANAAAHRTLFKRLVICGLLIGLPGAVVYGLSTMRVGDGGREVVGFGLGLLTAPFLTAAYASALLLFFQTPRGQGLVAWLAPAGRMALSNYLLQSLVCAWIFLAYGLRLIGSVGPLGGFAFAFSIFAAQLVLSRWWMGRFAYGPVEWLLRAFTLLEWPSMRKAQRVKSVES